MGAEGRPVELDAVAGTFRRDRLPVAQFERVGDEPLEAEAVDLEVRGVRHCGQEVDIFSKGGAERTAAQFGVNFLGRVPLEPGVREGGDSGRPVVLEGEDGPQSKAFYDLARRVMARVEEIKSRPAESVVQIR